MEADGIVAIDPLSKLAGRPPAQEGAEALARFDEALERHRPELLRYLRTKVANEADAADIAQDACTRLLVYRNRPGSGVDPRLMLFRIANHLVVDHYRHHRRRHAGEHVTLDEIGPLPSGEPAQVERIAAQRALQALKRAIARLPPRQRLVFMLNRFHGLTYAQIARKLEISETMVEKHIARAMLACRNAVGQHHA